MVKSIRGAVQFAEDSREKITERVQYLIKTILNQNNLNESDLINILFSITTDLRSINPAAALRAGGDFSETPLFCMQEPESQGAMERVIRVLITCEWNNHSGQPAHLYIDGAEKLRPDIN